MPNIEGQQNPAAAEQENKPAMNLLTNLDEVLSAMEKIEGESWLAQEREELAAAEKDPHDDYSVRAALGWLEGFNADSETRSPKGNTTIYGTGGGNRWFVREDGTVEFSEYHAQPRDVEKAKELGFKIS